jgi:lipoprotein-anchoring transpeptidase ErfK/SrfK
MALRQLSVVYLAAASSFAVAVTLAQHPMLNSAVHTGARFTAMQGEAAAIALNTYVIQPGWSLTKTQSAVLYRDAWNAINPPVQVAQQTVKAKPVVVAKAKPAPVVIDRAKADTAVAQLQKPNIVAPQTAPPALRPPIVEGAPAPDAQVAAVTPPAPKFTLAPQAMAPVPPPVQSATASALPPDRQPSASELAAVTQHLRDSLTQEMLANFELFLFVSKAEGTTAAGQRMYVFQKQDSGDLVLLHNWPVSTGREKVEFAPDGSKQPSFTPAGYYELDANRMYVHHFSGQWRQPMPYAMFFNWENHGYQTGLAIHSATGDDIGLLGSRASAGCVRLAPENARVLFSLIKNNYKGLMPKFAYDKRTATMANNGVLLHTTDGRLEMAEGYKVLVFIENYGGQNVVAALF